MSISDRFGPRPQRKIRYAAVGLGDITQEAMLPGIEQTGNSVLTALVTGDPAKARALADRCGVEDTYDYREFDAMLASGKVNAIYLATPNWRHAEFAIPALRAGIHVLCEKPLEVSLERGCEIAEAEHISAAKMMVAYRLHFEPATLDAIAKVRSGKIGEPVMFTSCFAQMLDPENHRAKHGVLAGPLLDMGPYPINAARYLFGDEPIEVAAAVAARHPEAGLGDMDDTIAVTLRFPGNRLAQFTVSYYANQIDSLIIAGTEGSIYMRPAYTYGVGLEQEVTVGDEKSHEAFRPTDQFGGELRYFSDCILNDRDPEPDVEEGLADLRVVEGILRAVKTGCAQPLEPFERRRRIAHPSKEETLTPTPSPEPVHASSPERDR